MMGNEQHAGLLKAVRMRNLFFVIYVCNVILMLNNIYF